VRDVTTLFKIGLFSWIEETCVSLGRKPYMFEKGVLAHCFSVIIELVFERNISYLSMFLRGRIIHFKNNTLFRWHRVTAVSFETIQTVLEVAVSCILFSRRMKFVFEMNNAYPQDFKWRIIQLIQNIPIEKNGRNMYITWRKLSLLEEGECSTLLTCENWDRLWKEYLLSASISE
jgi:hypothetical protein